MLSVEVKDCVLLCGGLPFRGVRTLNKLLNTYGDIPVVELVGKLMQPRPSWAVVVKELVPGPHKTKVWETYHKSFKGNWEELEYWVDDNNYMLVAWDGPYWPSEQVACAKEA